MKILIIKIHYLRNLNFGNYMEFDVNQLAVLLLFVFSVLLFSCKSNDIPEQYLSKLDAASQQELKNALSTDSEKSINFVMMLNENFTDNIVKSIEDSGAKIIAKSGKIITGNANANVVKELLKLESIKAIEINKTKSTN